MRHRLPLIGFLFLGLACLSCAGEVPAPQAPPAGPAAAAGPPRNVILISWDGLDRSVLKELLKAERLPNLAALIKAGSLQDLKVQGHETETRPGHAEMLTGLAAKVTGIESNLSEGAVPKGCSVFERLKRHFGKDGMATIMVTGKQYVGTLFANAEAAIDTQDIGSRRAQVVGPLCLAALEKHKRQRFFAFFHFLDPDSAGHGRGSASAEYRKAAELCDQWLGVTLAWLKQERLEGSTLVYVTTDHGFEGFSHVQTPDGWLATNDPAVKRGGIIADVPATILKRLGLDLDKLEPALLGQPLLEEAPTRKPEPQPAPAPVGS